jgi:uncharacterized membrane protein YeaQ/YmgE (transglycosylase-associated protein family)
LPDSSPKKRRKGGRKKMHLSRKKMGILSLGLITLVGAVMAAYSVYSNVAGVTLNYQVTLTIPSVEGSVIHLQAAVTYNGNPVGANWMVHFWRTDSGGTPIEYLGYSYTDGNGNAWKDYSAGSNGDYYFIARVDVP